MINPAQIRGNAAIMLLFAGGIACDAVAAVAGWLCNGLPFAFASFSATAVPYVMRAGTLRNLRVKADSNTSTTDTLVAIRINGVPSALVVNVPAGSTASLSNLVDKPTLAAGDTIDVAMANGAGGGAGNGLTLTVTVELI